MQSGRLTDLLQSYMQNTGTDAETLELAQLIAVSGNDTLDEVLEPLWVQYKSARSLGQQQADMLLTKILSPARPPVRKMYSRFIAAAAILLVITTGALLYIFTKRHRESLPAGKQAIAIRHDVPPGQQGAILTLSDGSTRLLDSAVNGLLATQGNMSVIVERGHLSYEEGISAAPHASLAYNTVTTPAGRQYQLTLPDGTRAWLNAASSLTYPIAFIGNDRTVQMTGEVYFEVAHNARNSFKVKAKGKFIEDIGTRFNVNAYTDEPVMATTLLEGTVRIEGSFVLKPGQKAVTGSSGHITIISADTAQAVAWKNGYFDFTDADLPTVMRQLARWYNVEVRYEGKIPQRQFDGMIGRELSLDQVLKGLTKARVHYHIENNDHLIITP